MIGRVKAMADNEKTEPDYEKILKAMLNSQRTNEHIGEVQEDVMKAAKLAGFLPKDFRDYETMFDEIEKSTGKVGLYDEEMKL